MITVYQAYFDSEKSTGSGRHAMEHSLGLELLYRGLKEEYGLELKNGGSQEEVISIEKGPHGKPYLAGYPGIYFNISHCSGLAVCGIGDAELGIDVECIRPGRENLMRRVLAAEEMEQLKKCEEPKQDEGFIRFWTLKESYVKAVGCGIGIPLREVIFHQESDGRICCNVPGYSFVQRKLDERRILSICVRGEVFGEWKLVQVDSDVNFDVKSLSLVQT